MIRFFKVLGAIALTAGLISAPTASFAGVFIGIGISVNTAPPVLPVYEQPPCPAPDLVWTPGYWAYADYGGYYWVPGAWVQAPQVGFLWTPGYWGYNGGAYGWHEGYWGRHVGFYGGVNYGFGYFGSGFYGGGWFGNHFRYNTAYVNVNRTVINNVYVNRTVINNYNTSTHVSYNGGPQGIRANPSAEELAYRNEAHVPPTTFQRSHIESAAQNRSYLASVNHGRPPVAMGATTRSNEAGPAAFDRPSYAGHPGTTGTKADPFDRFNRAPAVGSAYHPETYRSPSTYRSSSTYRAPETYGAPSTYHAPSTYNAPSTYRAPSTYGAPRGYGATRTYHAPVTHTQYHAAGAGGAHGGGAQRGGGGPHEGESHEGPHR